MKKKIFTLLCIISAFIFSIILVAFSGCNKPAEQSPPHPEKLEAPKNIVAENWVLTWDEVENATGYTVVFENTEYKVDKCIFDMSFYDITGTYTVEVMAHGDGISYDDSDFMTASIVLEDKIYDDFGFQYVLLSDGTGYSVRKGKADLTGNIVIPDYFCGLPVKEIGDFDSILEDSGSDLITESGANTVTTGIKLPAHLEKIGFSAFSNMARLEEIVIPDSVTSIGEEAFKGCTHLTKVVLPKGIKEIPESCFVNTALKEIDIPDTVERIENYAFSSGYLLITKKDESGNWIKILANHIPSELSSIVIPSSVKYIGDSAFDGRTNLKDITFEAIDNIEYMGEDVFNETLWHNSKPDGFICYESWLLDYKGGYIIGELEIPNGITRICIKAFYNQIFLTKVIIPESVKRIDGAFVGCNSLSEIIFLGDGPEFIGDGAFSGTAIEAFSYPSTVTHIGAAFSNCKSLKEIILPEGIEIISSRMFQNCSSLESITIPSSVTEIQTYAFAGCSSLKSINIPNGVAKILFNAFDGCSSLESVTLPEGLEVLESDAFASCSSLKEIILPDSLKSLSSNPFKKCESMTGVYFEGDRNALYKLLENIRYDVDPETKFKMIKANIDSWQSIPLYFYSETEPSGDGNFWHYVDGKPTPWN